MPEKQQYYIDHKHQVITQVMLDGIEHIICTYPKVWGDAKYYHYDASVHQNCESNLGESKEFQIHCFPQNSTLQTNNLKLFELLNEQWDFEIAKPPKKNSLLALTPTATDRDKVRKIVDAVFVLASLKTSEEKRTEMAEDLENQPMFDVYQSFVNQLEILLRDVKRSYQRNHSINTGYSGPSIQQRTCRPLDATIE